MILSQNQEATVSLCEQHHVESLYAFGSVLTTDFKHESDIDLLVTFNKVPLSEYADTYFSFKDALQTYLRHEIGLVEEQALKNPIFIRSISQTKQMKSH